VEEHYLDTVGVGGSIPPVPTSFNGNPARVPKPSRFNGNPGRVPKPSHDGLRRAKLAFARAIEGNARAIEGNARAIEGNARAIEGNVSVHAIAVSDNRLGAVRFLAAKLYA
jgi:hypothetical protein